MSGPDLTRWPEADDILDRALGMPVADRRAFVRQAASDADLVAALDAVLAEAAQLDGFLQPGAVWSGPLAHELAEAISDSKPAPQMLAPGARIEHYEVVGFLGRGGMGEVYRARDTKLGREVALKVLPEHFARDADRLARFRREARVLASLNHPGIGGIYGIAEAEIPAEDGGGCLEALVLELVEGPTLAERINGRALPIAEALAIGRRLIDALAAAHERGILHRDLKPANIKVLADGSVKILDFGLARALLPEPESGDAVMDITAGSPGRLLGTASYMSPEQARGERVDQRTDVWAFGCVLFEMLTGVRAFAGASVTEILARVIERDPAFASLPAATPPSIRRLLRRCLAKDPARRLGYVGDALLEFDEAADEPLREPAASSWLSALTLLLAGLLLGGAVVWLLGRSAPPPAAPVARLAVSLPDGDQPVTGYQPMPAISPDGRTIVYRARRNGVTQLFRRSIDALEPQPIPGTENATGPFFSPDARWLGFDSDGVLKRVSLEGGAPVPIAPAPGGTTATWLEDGEIVFATNTSRVLMRVPASGGTPVAITTLDQDRGDTLHLLPQALPGGQDVVFTIVVGAERHAAVLRLDTGAVHVLTAGTNARLVAGSYLVFARDGVLWAARFDAATRSLSGTPMPLSDRIASTDNTVLHAAVGSDTLVYLPPQPGGPARQLVWVDRQGEHTPIDLDPRPYVRVGLAPDGVRLALAVEDDENTDIWVADPEKRTMSRLTFDPTIDTMPTWSPDGQRIAFRSERSGPGIFQRDAQGAGQLERLTQTDGPIHSPYSWTPDGRTLLLALFRSFRSQAIGSVSPPDPKVHVLLDGDFAQLDPQVSRDGRWMAYQSDETGRFEVYVRPFPDVDAGRWEVSTAGGTSPRWSPDGRELFYFDGAGLAAVRVSADGPFAAGAPARLFDITPFGGRLGPDFEVAPDGQRFLFMLPAPTQAPRAVQLVLVQRWADELRTLSAR
jgi:eukaryotic-like serine/threonine-protein kinase